MAQETRVARASAGRRTTAALVVAGMLGLTGCSSVPDAVNPVEWYRGASDTVGGWFDDDEPASASTAGDPGPSPDSAYPNLSAVPQRPTPSTTPAEREALRTGLVADRSNARHLEQPGAQAAPASASPAPRAVEPAGSPPPPPASAPQAAAPQASAPQAAAPQAAAPPAPAAARPTAPSGEQSALWPNRPPPETPGLRPSTTGRVGDSITRGATPAPDPVARPAQSQTAESQTAESQTAARPAAGRTTYDSAGSGTRAPAPRSEPATAAATPAPSASSQSVIVNEDAIGGAPVAASFSGQPYLASTIYFGHGSSLVTAGERAALAEVARAAAARGGAVRVIGHASSRTAELTLRDHDVANFSISLKRAQAVANVLISAGVPAERVMVEALSDAQPEFYEVMPSGEAGNRRVEVVLIY